MSVPPTLLRRIGPLLPALSFLLLASSLEPCVHAAQDEGQTLVVGTKQAAPFSFREGDGPWEGVSIDLWRSIAGDLGLETEFREVSLEGLISGLEDRSLDASVGALTVTPAREERVDFTHPIHPSGLGIAVRSEATSSGWMSVVSNLFSVRFAQAVGTLIVVLFLGGAVVWLLERRRNPEQFGGPPMKALGSAFWWSAVTMTTVGYGDKAPVTFWGRFIGVVWMFAGVITISGLTATIASSLTVSRLEHPIAGPEDLHGHGRIACVAGSTGESYLDEEGLPQRSFDTAREALEAVADGSVQAAVYDQPILRHLVLDGLGDRVLVLPVTFERQDYAFALQLDSPWRKQINQALVERLSGKDWQLVLRKYLGTELP